LEVPINDFRSSLSLRDKAGMLAETAPHIENMSSRKGTLKDRFSVYDIRLVESPPIREFD
jgi:hypothetical protein